MNTIRDCLLLLIFTSTLASCVNNLSSDNTIATRDKAVYNKDNYNQLIQNEEQAILFKTVDYFSKNYPYSKNQLEDFFDIEFDINRKDINDTTIIESTYSSNYFENISLDDDMPYGQFLFLGIKKPICFNRKKFLERMDVDKYTLVPLSPTAAYGNIMDRINNKGTVYMPYKVVNDRQDICIKSLIFNTYELFDDSLYID